LRRGDLLLIASDGIETLSMSDLAALLERNRNSKTDELVDLIIGSIERCNAPQQDNVTLIAYRHR
jgi:serine/threonine protein phosphatase PrpC